MFKNGVYVVERPEYLMIYNFIRFKYDFLCRHLNLTSFGSPDHFQSYLDVFGTSVIGPLIFSPPYDNPRFFLDIHYQFAKWLDPEYNVRYYDFVKSYYDSLKV